MCQLQQEPRQQKRSQRDEKLQPSGFRCVRHLSLRSSIHGATHAASAAIRAALESAGVEFTNGDRPGVRLRKK